jgi:uncharacterized membrane protein YraQ (UPF0718 family)
VGYASGNWRLLVVLLGILMPLMWIVSGLLVYLILGLLFRVSVTGDTKNVGNASWPSANEQHVHVARPVHPDDQRHLDVP